MSLALSIGLAALLTATSGHTQQGGAPAPAQTMPQQGQQMPLPDISGFSVVLVVGEMQPSAPGSAQDLPRGAQRALNDMREFLPYKHYRVLDSQWTSCCSPRTRATVSGRLQGVHATSPTKDGSVQLMPRTYTFSITAGTSSPTITMRFLLDVEGRRASINGLPDLEKEREALRLEMELLQSEMQALERKVSVGAASGDDLQPLRIRYASAQRRLADLEKARHEASIAGQPPVIDSSFTMQPGETVVVGTSRLGGDKALIAVVTAVQKTK